MNIRFVVGLSVVIGALLLYHIYELKERLHAEKRRVMELHGQVSDMRLEEQDFRNLQMQIASQREQRSGQAAPSPTAPSMRIQGANEERNEFPAHVNYPTPHHIPTHPMESSSTAGRIRGANEERNEYPAHVHYPTPEHMPARPMESTSSNGPISAANEFMNEHPSGIPSTPNF